MVDHEIVLRRPIDAGRLREWAKVRETEKATAMETAKDWLLGQDFGKMLDQVPGGVGKSRKRAKPQILGAGEKGFAIFRLPFSIFHLSICAQLNSPLAIIDSANQLNEKGANQLNEK
jgi:hypothetical protein